MLIARPIRRLLIANRGEIAVRIARAARAAGIVPLGIVSEPDAAGLHARAMDDVATIGPGEASRSYLDIDRVLAAARRLRADAVHPGYGFLSERAAFARACGEANLVFVGPPPEAIDAMGDKSEAKRRARAHGIPVVPGYDGDDLSEERLRREAAAIGVPLLVKATAGGGGRGMRVVRDLAELGEALASARREALAAFGDDRVLLERYVERPRHVEVQIVADSHGTIVSLGERDCSIQRRHQKVLEEAPSPALGPELRARMTADAIAAARSVGYVNAGTVEFLLEPSGAYAFLEMNARLQVEHPVTEMVYGIDLVRLQFDVAEGKRLDPGIADRRPRGWAIEARVVAEDDAGLPAVGTIARWAPPVTSERVRLDSGVETGSTISIYYDSLLAKLVVHGKDRPAAVALLSDALGRFEVDGLPTNLCQLRAIAREPRFRDGTQIATSYLSDVAADLERPADDDREAALLLAAAALATDDRLWRIGRVGLPLGLEADGRELRGTLSEIAVDGDDATPGRSRWQLAGSTAATLSIERVSGIAAPASGEPNGDRLTVDVDGAEGVAPARLVGHCTVETAPGGAPSVVVTLARGPVRVRLLPPPAHARRRAAGGDGTGSVASPMPGKIARIAVAFGDVVEERALLVVLEAMKMEHRIVAPVAGRVTVVHVREGEVVAAGAALVEIERA